MSSNIASGLSSASIAIGSSGDNTIIAAQTGRSIAVHRLKLSLASSTTVQFKSGSTALSGAETCTQQLLDYDDEPYYRTASGEALVISLGSSVQCGGTVWYRLI